MFWNNKMKKAIVLAIIVNGIKASYTIWLSRILDGEFSVLYLTLFIGSSILITVPEIIMYTNFETSELVANKDYTRRFCETHKNSPEFILDKKFKKSQEALLVNENRKIFKESSVAIHNLINSSSSIVFDTFIISAVVDPLYMIAYATGGTIFSASMYSLTSKVDEMAIISLEKNRLLSGVLLNSWDDIVSGNKHNYDMWYKNYLQYVNDTEKAITTNAKFTRGYSSIVSLLASIPVIGVTLFKINSIPTNSTQITLLFNILTRQLHIIHSLNLLFSSIARWRGAMKSLQKLEKSILEPLSHVGPKYKLFFNEVSFFHNSKNIRFQSMPAFLHFACNQKKGRITIRSENGMGKSVLMCKLTAALMQQNKNIHFHYTNAKLLDRETQIGKSTGQKIKEDLTKVSKDSTLEFVLLDEWDANFDDSNIAEISGLIQQMAKKRCVVEIRHKEDKILNSVDIKARKAKPILISFDNHKKNITIANNSNNNILECKRLIKSMCVVS